MAEKRVDSFSSAILNIFHPQPPLLILAYFPNFPIFYFPLLVLFGFPPCLRQFCFSQEDNLLKRNSFETEFLPSLLTDILLSRGD